MLSLSFLIWEGVVKVRSRELASKGVIFSAFDILYHLYPLLYLKWSPHCFLLSSFESCCLIISDLHFLWARSFSIAKISFSEIFYIEVTSRKKTPKSFQVEPVKINTGTTAFWPLFPLLFLFLIQCNLNMHSNKPKTNFKIEPKKHISGLKSNSHWN